MSYQVNTFRLFLSSPTDLESEREVVLEAIDQINSISGIRNGYRIEPVTWDRNVRPGVGQRPQEIINQQVGDRYDIFLGIMCGKFGSSTGLYGSGTEEEFRRAFERVGAGDNLEVLMYFKDPRSSEQKLDVKELVKIQEFKDSISDNVLWKEFSDVEAFKTIVIQNIAHAVDNLLSDASQKDDSVPHANAALDDRQTDDEDLGILDLADIVEDSFERLVEDTETLNRGITNLGEKTRKRTEEMNSAKNSDGKIDSKFQRKILKKTSNDLDEYSDILEELLPRLKDKFATAISAMRKSVIISSEDDFDDVEGAKFLAASLQQTRDTFTGTRNQVDSFGDTIANLPRLTSDVNKSKRIARKKTTELVEFFDTSVSQISVVLDHLDVYIEGRIQ